MNQIKLMASAGASKAFVAALIAMISSATLAATESFTVAEILTIIGAGIVAFQATYWTTNTKSESSYDGALIVDTSDPVKDTYSLEVTTPLEEINEKSEIVLKVNN